MDYPSYSAGYHDRGIRLDRRWLYPSIVHFGKYLVERACWGVEVGNQNRVLDTIHLVEHSRERGDVNTHVSRGSASCNRYSPILSGPGVIFSPSSHSSSRCTLAAIAASSVRFCIAAIGEGAACGNVDVDDTVGPRGPLVASPVFLRDLRDFFLPGSYGTNLSGLGERPPAVKEVVDIVHDD
jgi:hypothetical protein